MKITLSLLCIVAFTIFASGQESKSISQGVRSPRSKECSYTRQLGKLEIRKDMVFARHFYTTDSLEMVVIDTSGAALLLLNNRKRTRYREMDYFPLDSLTTLLFQNGLLTPDMLVDVFNEEYFRTNEKGDTVPVKKPTSATTLNIYTLKQRVFDKKFKIKENKNELRLNISLVFEDEPRTIYVFTLLLVSDRKFRSNDLIRFLKAANIKCLRFSGFEI